MVWRGRGRILTEQGDPIVLESGEYIALDGETTAIAQALSPRVLTEAGELLVMPEAGGGDFAVLLEGTAGIPVPQSGPFQDDAVFPLVFGKNSTNGYGFRTTMAETSSGDEWRVAHWARELATYQVALAKLTPTEIQSVVSFYRERAGAQEGFRGIDLLDWTTAPDHRSPVDTTIYEHRVLLGATRYDAAELDFQLLSEYQQGFIERKHRVTHPIKPGQPGHSMNVWLDNTLLIEGTQYTVDYSTGILSLAAWPGAGGRIRWAGHYHKPMRFGENADALLGVVYPFPEVWDLDFDVNEIRQDGMYGDLRDRGGVVQFQTNVDTQLSITNGRLQIITPLSGGLTFYLPRSEHFVPGMEHLWVMNASGTHSFVLSDFNGTPVATIPANGGAELLLRENIGGSP